MQLKCNCGHDHAAHFIGSTCRECGCTCFEVAEAAPVTIDGIMEEFYEPFKEDSIVPPCVMRGMLNLAWEAGKAELLADLKATLEKHEGFRFTYRGV